MDQIKTGKLIRYLRQKHNLTQLALAEMINVSDKTISKWERGCGIPDISLLPKLSEVLDIDMESLLKGNLEENDMSNGNIKKMKFFLCPECGNLIFTTDGNEIRCCSKKLTPLSAQKVTPNHTLNIVKDDNELYITSDHEMNREHYISFLALVNEDTMVLKKLYPEWGMELRLPFVANSTFFWYCSKHGLFYQDI